MPPIDLEYLSALASRVKLTLNTLPPQLLDAGRRGPPDERNRRLLQEASATHMDTLDALSDALVYLEDDTEEPILLLQEQVESSLEQIRSALAPVRQLPVELLQVIFQLAHQLAVRGPHDGRGPPAVAQVCYLWRQVALGTPCLWSVFTLCLDPRRISSQLERLSLSIQRCGNHLLNVLIHDIETCVPFPVFDFIQGLDFTLHTRTIDEEPLDPPITEELMEESGVAIARALEPYGSKLGALRLEVEWKRTVLAMFRTWHQSPSFSMPSLKLMEFASWYSATEFDWLPMKDFFRDRTPGLQSLVQTQALPEPNFAVPPPTLKVFCGYLDATTFPSINACKDLEILELRYFYQWDELQPPFGTTTLAPFNNLTSLHLILHDFTSAVANLPPLPSLKHLILTHDDKYSHQVNLHPMLQAWGAKLKYLSIIINMEYTTTSDLQACLDLAPELEALRLRWSSDLPILLGKAKLPRLTHCTFNVLDTTPTVRSGFRNFVTRAKSDYFPRLTVLGIEEDYGLNGFDDYRARAQYFSTLATDLSQTGVTLNYKQLPDELGNFRFKGPYFDYIGGIFTSDLYFFNNN